MNNIKQAMEKIEIPKELDSRVAIGVKEAKVEKRKRRDPKWVVAAVGAIMIMGTGLTIGGPHLAGAAESIISQLFGSKENLIKTYPDDEPEKFDLIEQSLVAAQEILSEEEYNEYTKLIKELVELKSKLQRENREPSGKEANRSHQIKELMQPFEDKFMPTFIQSLASFPIIKPIYIPDGYNKVYEGFEQRKISEEPSTSLQYRSGESLLVIEQHNKNQIAPIEEPDAGVFEKIETYVLEGYHFEFSTEGEMAGMRVTVPEEGYKLILTANHVSKEEMEKVLLSMIEQ
ncbi:hypothetical protein [Neobacillus niacini]|uniref:hypothetical protein n=1 Tax=Neobacillus niacini TaxID=86668 RepID=UPI003982E277